MTIENGSSLRGGSPRGTTFSGGFVEANFGRLNEIKKGKNLLGTYNFDLRSFANFVDQG